MSTAQELAHAIHDHITKRLRLQPGYAWGVVQEVDPGTTNTLQVTLNGSSTIVPGVRYLSAYVGPQAGDQVLVHKLSNGEYVVAADLA